MKRIEQIIFLILLAGWLITVPTCVYYKWQSNNKHPEPTPEVKTETKQTVSYLVDSTTHRHETKNVYNSYSYTLAAPSVIDTSAIILDYYTKRAYRDTVADSLISITTIDTIFNNRLARHAVSWKFLKPYQTQVLTEKTTTITIKKSVNGFYIAPFAGYSLTGKNLYAFGFEADYIMPRVGFGLGFDAINTGVQGKILFKVGK
ncbi:MAG: hypothetical protein KF900_13965 [Bacteroidetes bacterium]|nr:hypothetical protein [Bacteroidota bacterium]